jgi:hypothetical protein
MISESRNWKTLVKTSVMQCDKIGSLLGQLGCRRAKYMGLQLTQDYVLRQLPPETSITAAFTSITSELMAKSQGIRPQLLVVVLENRRSPRYKDIKHYGDTNGFTTQVVTSETVKSGEH